MVCSVSEEVNEYFVRESKVLKLVVHTMKNWYLEEKENVESRVLIIKLCCEVVTAICATAGNQKVANAANEAHVTSSLIKLIIAHQQQSASSSSGVPSPKKGSNAATASALKQNPYLNRISSFIAVLRAMAALCRGNDEITVKVAKHAMKTILKVELHSIFYLLILVYFPI